MQVIDSGLIFICSFVTVVVFTLTEMGGQPPHTARGHFRFFRVFASAAPQRTLGAASKAKPQLKNWRHSWGQVNIDRLACLVGDQMAGGLGEI